jgi:hypothetical protein
MVRTFRGVGNDKLTVNIILPEALVTLTDLKTNYQRHFCGIPGLDDRLKEFETSFNDNIDFDTAVYFFTPVIGSISFSNGK